MRRIVVFALVCAWSGAFAAPARAQARADTGDRGWMVDIPTVQSLTVMIDATEQGGCRGSGFIVGLDSADAGRGGALYGVTARHVVAHMGLPRVLGASIGVRTVKYEYRVRREGGPDEVRRRVLATVTHESEALDLAVFRIDDAALATQMRGAFTRFSALASAADLGAGDQVYAVGCAGEDGAEWDTPLETVGLEKNDRATGALLIPMDYIRGGFSGGPLLHVLGLESAIVGMTQTTGRGQDIQRILDQLRRWKVPVQLSAFGSQPGCQFDVTPKKVLVEPIVDRPSPVTLKGTPGCRWRGQTEHRSWFHITGGVIGVDGTGVAEVVVSRGPRPDVPLFNPCEPERRQQIARIGGRLIDVSARCAAAPATRP